MRERSGTTRRCAALALALGAVLLGAPGASAAPGDVTVARVADINPGLPGSNPQELIDAGGILLFAATDGTHGTELWKSDGGPLGPGGTEMVADIEMGSGNSTPGELTNIGGTVLFRANTSSHGSELWKIAPPYTTPVEVENINPTGSSNPSDLTDVNGTLFFGASDGMNGQELWKSAPPYDAASTEMVENIATGSADSSPNGLFNDAGTLFFDANDGTDDDLWRSEPPDYDAASTTKVDVNPSGDSFPGPFAQVNGTLFFQADDGSGDGFELFKLPAPFTTPTQVKDINPSGDANVGDLINVGGTLFLTASDGGAQFGRELWKSVSPFGAGSTTALDINPGSGDSDASQLRNIGGTVFLGAGDGVHSIEPWRSNGGPVNSGTDLVEDINPSGGSNPFGFTNVNGTAFFAAFTSAGPELYRSTGAGAEKVSTQFSSGSAPNLLTDVGGTLFFAATDGATTTGQELWKATIEQPPPPPPPPPATAPTGTSPAAKKKCKKHKKRRAGEAKKKKCKKKKRKP